jgi:hypothetical protein
MNDVGFDVPESPLKHFDEAAGNGKQDALSAAWVRGLDRAAALR